MNRRRSKGAMASQDGKVNRAEARQSEGGLASAEFREDTPLLPPSSADYGETRAVGSFIPGRRMISSDNCAC